MLNKIHENSRKATDCITGESVKAGEGIMFPSYTSSCISYKTLEKAIKAGKIKARNIEPKNVEKLENIKAEFNVSFKNIDNKILFGMLAVNGVNIVRKVNATTYRLSIETVTRRGLQKRMNTFDNLIVLLNGTITKFTSSIDGIKINRYDNSFEWYKRIDETTIYRKTTIKVDELEKNTKRCRA